ncbi:hypothetical protein V1264_017169 [Littorina saxatilis]|uniref:Tyr recombinase domain-containing protein n=1 Tax=Littorina saxatilis TaxID=31220 RepID=A0AAN9GF40_9CAEN
MAKRFATYTEDEIAKKRSNLTPVTTKRCTDSSVRIFRHYLKEKGKGEDFEAMSKNELNSTLGSFYMEARSESGDLYKRKTLEGIRYGLNRHLKSPPHNNDFDIVRDSDFSVANEMFKAAVKELKQQGKGNITHYEPMAEADRQKLYHSMYMNTATPTGLANKVQFDVRYYFSRRGAENMHSMTKTTFRIKTDATTNREYVCKNSDELTKNHQHDTAFVTGFMPATLTDSCPVESFRQYISHLNPDCDRLWVYPLDTFSTDSPVWYAKKPIGVNSMSQFLPRLSKSCGLSQVYTNHSIRATSATVLHQSSFTPAEIMAVTGHRSVSALTTYQRTSDAQKLQMGDALAIEASSSSLTRTQTVRQVQGAPTVMAGSDYETLDCFFDEIHEPRDESVPQMRKIVFQNCTINNINITVRK